MRDQVIGEMGWFYDAFMNHKLILNAGRSVGKTKMIADIQSYHMRMEMVRARKCKLASRKWQ